MFDAFFMNTIFKNVSSRSQNIGQRFCKLTHCAEAQSVQSSIHPLFASTYLQDLDSSLPVSISDNVSFCIYLARIVTTSDPKQALGSPSRTSQRFFSVSDSRASKTAAPTRRYVNVQTIKVKVRTFCFFILWWTPCWVAAPQSQAAMLLLDDPVHVSQLHNLHTTTSAPTTPTSTTTETAARSIASIA